MGFLLIQIISRSLRNFSEVVFQQFFPTTFRNGLILVPLFSFIWSHNLGFIIFTALLSVKTDKLDLDIYIWLGDGNAEVYSWMFQALFGISCLILVSLPQ